jgi:hypothetical protein
MIARPTQAEFKLKFDGKPNELDAATLVTSLSSLTALIEESNREIGGGARLRIAVKALDKGSFLIHLGLGPDITEAVQNLLSTVDLDTLYKVVGSVVGFFTLRKLLKGEKPKNVDEKGPDYQITTAQGNMFVVDKRTYNIYNTNPRVNDAIGTTFEALSNDPSVTGFEMLDEHDKKLFEANRLDFEPMSIRTDDLQDDKRITTVAAILTIFKVIFEDKYKWEFYYKGNRISAKMADVEFSKRVDSGERFAKGDRLQVELQIEQAFDTAANTFVNKSYQVLRVIKHLPRGAQERLDFESSDNKK